MILIPKKETILNFLTFPFLSFIDLYKISIPANNVANNKIKIDNNILSITYLMILILKHLLLLKLSHQTHQTYSYILKYI